MGLAASRWDAVIDALNEKLNARDFPQWDPPSIVRSQMRADEKHGFDPYAEPRRLIQRFKNRYSGDKQLLEFSEARIRSHNENLKQLYQILSPLEKPAFDDSVGQSQLKQIETALAVFCSENQIGPISCGAFKQTASTTANLLSDANRILHDVAAIGQSLRKTDEFLSSAERLFVERESLQKLTSMLQEAQKRNERIARLSKAVLDLAQLLQKHYLKLALQQDFRPALQDLNRLAIQQGQEQIVCHDYTGCRRIEGVSGSGKTIVLLHRAIRLCHQDKNAQVRIFTVNRSLAELLQRTCAELCVNEAPENLTIQATYDFLYDCVAIKRNVNSFRLSDPQSGERVPAAWKDFFNHHSKDPKCNVFVSDAVKKLIVTLKRQLEASRTDAGEYLFDEMTYIQSAYRISERDGYLKEPRTGRKITLKTNLRKACLLVLKAWESYLLDGALWSVHGLGLVAIDLFDNPKTLATIQDRFPSHHILVDEYQDFSTVELQILKKLIADPGGRNAFFFAGDVNQKVYAKQLNVKKAGFNFKGRSSVLRQNFRNTRQVFLAANALRSKFPPPHDDDTQKYMPELSHYDGAVPLVLNCTYSDQAKCIFEAIQLRTKQRVAVVSENTRLLDDVRRLVKESGCRIHELHRNEELDLWKPSDDNMLTARLIIARMEAVKGFEFDTVVVGDVSDGVIPKPSVPADEYWRAAGVVYSAITRARDELILTWARRPSIFLNAMTGSGKSRYTRGIKIPDRSTIRQHISVCLGRDGK